MFPSSLWFLCLCASLVAAVETDYYWRDFNGSIPEDAIIGGKNIDGVNVYIGQAYVNAGGLIVVQINPGEKEVKAPIRGVKNVTRYIKILCGCQDNFIWLPSNSTNLHMDLLNKTVVIGGHENGRGSINVGRISYEGGTQIGKINAFAVGDAVFKWADWYGNEPGVTSYEVLIFEKNKYCKT